VEVVAGTWGAEDREGTVLVVNTGLRKQFWSKVTRSHHW